MLTSLIVAAVLAHAASFDDPERRAPDPKARAHALYAWTSEGGLRYTWCLPEGYDPAQPRNLTVICHGTGLDYRWGTLNNLPGVFRPDDVVVSVDGPTPDGQARLFLGEPKDAQAMRAFLGEMRKQFAVDRVFLYGHSQGGFFVVYFAGEFPDEVAGVVAHASGAWNWSKTGKDVRQVAICFMHGTQDQVVPYRQSPGSRDHYAGLKFELLSLRRLADYSHWPNAVRANECLSWCQGMSARDPAEALAAALEILRPKKSDEYQWETVVGFAQARDVLRRLVGEGPAPFEAVDPKLVEHAQRVIEALEKEGARHVAVLQKQVKKGLALDGKPWLGHLIALREDFRGVDSVEAYVKAIGFDKQCEAQRKAVEQVLTAWYGDAEPSEKLAEILDGLAGGYLFEGYPPELSEQVETWKAGAKLDKKAEKKYAGFAAWREAWKDGTQQYADLWKDWKGPPGS